MLARSYSAHAADDVDLGGAGARRRPALRPPGATAAASATSPSTSRARQPGRPALQHRHRRRRVASSRCAVTRPSIPLAPVTSTLTSRVRGPATACRSGRGRPAARLRGRPSMRAGCRPAGPVATSTAATLGAARGALGEPAAASPRSALRVDRHRPRPPTGPRARRPPRRPGCRPGRRRPRRRRRRRPAPRPAARSPTGVSGPSRGGDDVRSRPSTHSRPSASRWPTSPVRCQPGSRDAARSVAHSAS